MSSHTASHNVHMYNNWCLDPRRLWAYVCFRTTWVKVGKFLQGNGVVIPRMSRTCSKGEGEMLSPSYVLPYHYPSTHKVSCQSILPHYHTVIFCRCGTLRWTLEVLNWFVQAFCIVYSRILCTRERKMLKQCSTNLFPTEMWSTHPCAVLGRIDTLMSSIYKHRFEIKVESLDEVWSLLNNYRFIDSELKGYIANIPRGLLVITWCVVYGHLWGQTSSLQNLQHK